MADSLKEQINVKIKRTMTFEELNQSTKAKRTSYQGHNKYWDKSDRPSVKTHLKVDLLSSHHSQGDDDHIWT